MIISRSKFFSAIRSNGLHRNVSGVQVAGYEAILDYWQRQTPLLSIEQLAYIFATAYHETGGRMEPVREGFAKTDAGAIAAVESLYKKGRINRNYATPDSRTGKSYYGRGLAQVTHYDNYKKVGECLGIDLVNNPDLLLILETSVQALIVGMRTGLFTGKKLSDYINTNKVDYRNARRIVNGLDKADLIAEYAKKFEEALRGGDAAKLKEV